MWWTATFSGRIRRLRGPQVLAAAGVALVVELGLSVTTVPHLAGLLGIKVDNDGQPAPPGPMSNSTALWIRRRSVAVERVLRHWPFGDTCLRRALVLGQRIRRLDPVLLIGVRHDEDGRLAAHAWLTVDGAAWDPLVSLYSPFSDLTGK